MNLQKLFPHLDFDPFFEDEAYAGASGWLITPDYDNSVSAIVFLPDEEHPDYNVATVDADGEGTITDGNLYEHAANLGEAFDRAAALLGHCRMKV